MKTTARTATALIAALIPAMWLGAAQAAESTINVSLWDKGATSMDMMGKMPAMGMMMTPGVDMGMVTMGITLDAATVPAGNVTFNATNASKDMLHEMLVAPITDPAEALPYDKETLRVDEEASGDLGEVSELEPGKTGSLTLELKPGSYILFCNIPGHYELGMWTLLTVTE